MRNTFNKHANKQIHFQFIVNKLQAKFCIIKYFYFCNFIFSA